MDPPYDDGLDDFDRELLGRNPLRIHPVSSTVGQQGTPGYFPTPSSSNISNTDGYGAYFEATILPSPGLEPESLRPAMLPEGARRISHTQDVFLQEPAHLARDRHHSRQAGAASIQAEPYVWNSQSGRSNASHFPGTGGSSPTARLIARRRQNAPPPSTNFTSPMDTSSPIPSTPTVHSDQATSTPVVHGIPLVSLRQALPDRFRSIFPYELLNAVQSKCFDVVYHTNDNVVVAAPTGSGKTAILELAICKLALDRGNENFKIVYQAPTKALCAERARDWDKKFSHMNLKCAELTGDTSQAEMRRVGDASIIVTTPEKWDSITRKWHDHRRLLQVVELFLIDEVHILKDARGATLEAVVSRMKTIGANVRFLALSATVPNSEDIARWLGRNHTNQQLPAHREAFGEEFRPVKLQKFVYGFESNSNDFIFDRFLDQKLPGLIARHTRQKPILVFCFTRKSCESTASLLAEFASGRPDGDRLWPVPSQRVPVLSRELQEIVKFGVAFHHAGLDAQDRTAIEQNFLKGQLGVICCTSTLAVGVNLPCHTVILKGTVGFSDERLEEYSDLEVMQMLGRAGRPQFDDSATAIVLTRAANKERYQKMVSGQEVLESTLHLNLIEHLNSEICLGTIHNLASAKTWLGGTFLSVRLRRNPNYYQLTGGSTNVPQIDDGLEEICERDIKQLQDAELVTDQESFRCTEYGRAMSKYMVEFLTMRLLLQIPRGVGMEALITILSQASEFKEFRFKPAERPIFREINQSPLIMYPVKEAVTQTRHKISLMIQAHLGCVQYPDSSEAAKVRRQLAMERKLVFERLNRLVRAVIDCKGHDRDSVGTKTALELARALAAESWEGRATQLTQVPNIGPVGMRKLASKDIRTVLQLADKDYDEIERLLSRQPPFGKNLQAVLEKFPRLDVEAAVVRHRLQPRSEEPVVIEVKATLRYLNRKGPPNWLNRVPALTFLAETSDGVLVYFWRGSMRKLDAQAGLELRFSVALRDVNDYLVCQFSCEEIVGTVVSKKVEHKLPASVFPQRRAPTMVASSRGTRANSHAYLDNDEIEDSDLLLAAEKALAHSSTDAEARVTAEEGIEEYPPVDELREMAGSGSQAADEFDSHLAAQEDADEMDPTQITPREPTRLPNGKWQCNHTCSGGAPTRSGKPCNHRCCREGLDKPRRRLSQRTKRTSESAMEGTVDLARSGPSKRPQQHSAAQGPASGTQNPAKRQKVHASGSTSSLTQTTLVLPCKRLNDAPENARKNVDFNTADLECIDLSGIDEDDGDIFKTGPHGLPEGAGAGADAEVSKKPAPKAAGSSADGITQPRTDSQTATTAPISATPLTKPQTHSAEQQGDYGEAFDDDDFLFLENSLSPRHPVTPGGTASAFKSGASDEALYQGISEKFAKTGGAGVSHQDLGDEDISMSQRPVDNPSSSLFIDDVPQLGPDTSPNSPSEHVVSAVSDGGAAANATGTNLEKQHSRPDEPAWVAEFDPEFVDMFRGFVTFV